MMLYAPVLLLVVYSFNMSREIGIWSDEWGFSLYVELFQNQDIMTTVVNTFVLEFIKRGSPPAVSVGVSLPRYAESSAQHGGLIPLSANETSTNKSETAANVRNIFHSCKHFHVFLHQ